MASPKKKKSQFSISLNLGGKVFKSTGTTPVEALNSLPKPDKIFLKGIVTVSDGTHTKEMLMQPVKVKQLFYYSAGIQAVKAKQLFMALK